MPEIKREVAGAKLTRSLAVTGRRDDGYHLIESEMVSLDLCDELAISPGDGLDVVDEIAWVGAAGLGGSIPIPSDDSNLVRRALKAVNRTAAVRLVKRIPPGAGLGGGSSDAAAVLRWAGVHDLAGAARIGADVAFCLAGGRARVCGIGEIVEPLVFKDLFFVLVTPRLPVSTVAVYRAWDELGGPVGEGGNHLEPAAVLVEPLLARWRELLGEVTGLEPRLAGSGSSWFVECESAAQAASLEAHLVEAVLGTADPALVRACRSMPATPSAPVPPDLA